MRTHTHTHKKFTNQLRKMHHLWQKPGMAPRHWLNSCGRAEQPWTPEEVFTTAQTTPPHQKYPMTPTALAWLKLGGDPETWTMPQGQLLHITPTHWTMRHSLFLGVQPEGSAGGQWCRRNGMSRSAALSVQREKCFLFPSPAPPAPTSPWWEFWFRAPASGPLVWNINRSSRLACILFKMSTTRSQQIAKSVMKKWKKWEKLLGEVSLAAGELKMIVTANVGSY